MKLERSDVKFAIWRKKVDASLFQYKSTPIPNWACDMWGIEEAFYNCISKRDSVSMVNIKLDKDKRIYKGWVTRRKDRPKFYQLSFSGDLQYRLKDIFLMSFMRDIEFRLRKDKAINIEDEIPSATP